MRTDHLTDPLIGQLGAGRPVPGLTALSDHPLSIASVRALREISVVTPVFVKGVCLIALLAVIATGVGLWARTRSGARRRPRLTLTMAVLGVIASQVLVLGALSVRANANLGFVRTVDDLATAVRGELTTGPSGPVALHAPTPQDTATPPSTALPSPHPGDVTDFKPVTNDPDHKGFYLATVTGRRSGVTQEIWVWAPRGYSPKDSRTYPVLIFLHGDPGTAAGAASALKTAQVAQAAIDKGIMPPALIVFPDLRADDRQAVSPDCADVAGQAKVGTWVQDDVPAVIRAAFPNASPNRSGWGIAGLSSGGYCSVWTGIMRPETFGYIISMSGYDAPVVGSMAADPAVQSANMLSTLWATRPHPPLRLWVLAAQDDWGAVDIRTQLPPVVQAPDTVDLVTPQAGGHATSLWRESFPTALDWWGQQLKSPVPAETPSAQETGSASPSPAPTAARTSQAGAAADAGGQTPPRNLGEKLLMMFTGIRGAGLITMVWIAAVVLSVVAVMSWRRRPVQAGDRIADEVPGTRSPRAPGRLEAAGRAAALILARTWILGLACLAGSLALGLVVNRLGAFYPSWSVAINEIIYALA